LTTVQTAAIGQIWPCTAQNVLLFYLWNAANWNMATAPTNSLLSFYCSVAYTPLFQPLLTLFLDQQPTDLISLFIFFLFLLGRPLHKKLRRFITDQDEIWQDCSSSKTHWGSFFDMTSYFQDGGRYVISCNKVLTSGEWKVNICQRVRQLMIYSVDHYIRSSYSRNKCLIFVFVLGMSVQVHTL